MRNRKISRATSKKTPMVPEKIPLNPTAAISRVPIKGPVIKPSEKAERKVELANEWSVKLLLLTASLAMANN
ncbi:hypothetical protein D3C77_778840 [compost metagenome]